jgi:hypothetical protein
MHHLPKPIRQLLNPKFENLKAPLDRDRGCNRQIELSTASFVFRKRINRNLRTINGVLDPEDHFRQRVATYQTIIVTGQGHQILLSLGERLTEFHSEALSHSE